MSEKKYSKEQIRAAFEAWHKDYSENPDNYIKQVEHDSPEAYTTACADNLIRLMEQ